MEGSFDVKLTCGRQSVAVIIAYHMYRSCIRRPTHTQYTIDCQYSTIEWQMADSIDFISHT